ncbi:MAG TPA: hypothetical protein H9955_11350 [Candidatus Mediterraneibacter cottocaccae]|nr:hypothetical protein [Candidatus Mediterraneibacter cottocaccae]
MIIVSPLNNNSVSASGTNYIKYNNGRLIQWGEASVSSGGYVDVTFSQAFVDTNYIPVAQARYPSGGEVNTFLVCCQKVDKTKVRLYAKQPYKDAIVTGVSIYWVAYGDFK